MRAQCLPEGPGYLFAMGPDLNWAMSKVIQTPSLIVILNADLTYRQIFTDGRALEADANPSWMGYSVGRWEGDTLVVESAGFNDLTWLLGGYPHTEGLRTIERYRRPDFGHLTFELELHDPTLYAKPWTATINAELAADTELLEYVCNENKTFHEHWVGTRSDAARSEITIAAEALAKYAGTYTERQPFWQGRGGRPRLRDQVRRRRAVSRADAATPAVGNRLRQRRSGDRVRQRHAGRADTPVRQARVGRLPIRSHEVGRGTDGYGVAS